MLFFGTRRERGFVERGVAGVLFFFDTVLAEALGASL